VSAVQFARARALALAHGHLWAQCPETEGLTDAEEILSVVTEWDAAEGVPSVCGGIYAPTVDEDGDVVHTTGTGRLSWCVYEDGHTTISIARPTGWVATVSVCPDGDWSVDVGGEILERHVDAALVAVRALVPPATADDIERRLMALSAEPASAVEAILDRAVDWAVHLEASRENYIGEDARISREIANTLATARRRADALRARGAA
jgi:hypothetical protein